MSGRHGVLACVCLVALALAGCTEGPAAPEPRQDEKTLMIPAGEGLEYKFYLREGDRMDYVWESGQPLYVDFHGEPDSGGSSSHKRGTLDSDAGTFTAPFTGHHGFYWRNDHSVDVDVTLQTEGTYTIIGVV